MVNSVKEINTTSELQEVVHDVLVVEHLMIMFQIVEVVTFSGHEVCVSVIKESKNR